MRPPRGQPPPGPGQPLRAGGEAGQPQRPPPPHPSRESPPPAPGPRPIPAAAAAAQLSRPGTRTRERQGTDRDRDRDRRRSAGRRGPRRARAGHRYGSPEGPCRARGGHGRPPPLRPRRRLRKGNRKRRALSRFPLRPPRQPAAAHGRSAPRAAHDPGVAGTRQLPLPRAPRCCPPAPGASRPAVRPEAARPLLACPPRVAWHWAGPSRLGLGWEGTGSIHRLGHDSTPTSLSCPVSAHAGALALVSGTPLPASLHTYQLNRELNATHLLGRLSFPLYRSSPRDLREVPHAVTGYLRPIKAAFHAGRAVHYVWEQQPGCTASIAKRSPGEARGKQVRPRSALRCSVKEDQLLTATYACKVQRDKQGSCFLEPHQLWWVQLAAVRTTIPQQKAMAQLQVIIPSYHLSNTAARSHGNRDANVSV
ncbi:uncharacterized protein LOC142038554 [Buteo buteo]|uniref:uncharacterized protein LOC142038554 n=1 Tax=Buteo buteo TaxID=30397 RepID=UPI003EBD68D5